MKIVRKVKKTQREFVTVIIKAGDVQRVSGVTVYHMQTGNCLTIDCTGKEVYEAIHKAETLILEHIKME